MTLMMLLSGCGGTPDANGHKPASGGGASSTSARPMAGMRMSDDSSAAPSSTARMVCQEDEIRDAVKRTFQMRSDPTSTHTWSTGDRLYACRWAVPHGSLIMTVQDGNDLAAGRAYFDRLRRSLDDARTLRGMDNFGFPAASTRAGDVLFLKDGKTLHVDATRLPSTSLPPGFSRSEAAYSVAAAVIACWNE